MHTIFYTLKFLFSIFIILSILLFSYFNCIFESEHCCMYIYIYTNLFVIFEQNKASYSMITQMTISSSNSKKKKRKGLKLAFRGKSTGVHVPSLSLSVFLFLSLFLLDESSCKWRPDTTRTVSDALPCSLRNEFSHTPTKS